MAWETAHDKRREYAIGMAIRQLWPGLRLYETPPFHPTDAHAVAEWGYAGDFEFKWYNKPSSEAVVFNYNKWQNLYLLDVALRRPQAHRIAVRFDDGLLVFPVTALAHKDPVLFTRKDTNETDLILRFTVGEMPDHYWHDLVISE